MAAADKTIFECPVYTLSTQLNGDMRLVIQPSALAIQDYGVPLALLAQWIKGNSFLTIYSGDNNPDNAQGSNGDLYFQSSGKVYQKINGVWVLKANIGTKTAVFNLPVGTQLTSTGGGNYVFRIPNLYGTTFGTSVRSNGEKIFIADKINGSNIDFPLPDYGSTGLTTQPYIITISWIDLDGSASLNSKYKLVATYGAMIADGTPSVKTSYKITADENFLGATTTYDYYPDGDIMLTSSSKVN